MGTVQSQHNVQGLLLYRHYGYTYTLLFSNINFVFIDLILATNITLTQVLTDMFLKSSVVLKMQNKQKKTQTENENTVCSWHVIHGHA